MSINFEWDKDKAAANKKKHGVTFEEAATVFDDPLAAIFDDEAHSKDEQREIIVGHSTKKRLLLVCFTERAGAVRIISARRATKRERKDYEENPC
ncbi:MAG TPA: BrnT family toxin [Gemmataceae bacterium]|nr:BrnT family toxin [Gemmataceae bacterium]